MLTPLLNWLSQNVPGLKNLHGLPLAVLAAVAMLTLCFVIGYATQGARTGWQLSRAVRRLRALATGAGARANGQIDPDEVARVLAGEPLRHLWDEYANTLHAQPADDGALHGARASASASASASPAARRVRATVPAETFFTREALVDNRLFDDFTRHLPGVLTGLGILGTFAGLLDGLGGFDPSDTATAVAGLKPLLDGVAHAFGVSALAIGCAMFVTFTSRLCLALFYRQVEALTHAIDGLYATGAGEEYLSRLVASSEKAEGHAAELKRSLVHELSTLMSSLTERQIAAQRDAQQALADAIGERIGDALGAKLAERIGERVGDAMHARLGDLGPRLADTIGERLSAAMAVPSNQLGQIARMMKLAQQNAEAAPAAAAAPAAPPAPVIDGAAIGRTIEDAIGSAMARAQSLLQAAMESSLQGLVRHAHDSGQALTDRLQGSLEEAVTQSVTMQTLLLDELRGFVAHLDHSREAAASQDEARGTRLASQTRDLVDGLSTHTGDLVAELSTQTKELVGGLSTRIGQLLEAVVRQGSQTQRHIDLLGQATGKAIAGLSAGAGSLAGAAQRFETAGQAVSGVLERSTATAAHLAATSESLAQSARAVQAGFARYDETRQTVDTQVQALTGLIAAVRQEAGLSQRMIGDLDRIVEQLKIAEAQSQQYLEGINRALVRSFEEFGGALASQLKNTIGDTDRHLSSGVQQLNGVVQHIGLTLSRIRAN
ncbi:MAG: anti-phage ZorAB system protein ZorA [Burkholderiaceae bacterium]